MVAGTTTEDEQGRSASVHDRPGHKAGHSEAVAFGWSRRRAGAALFRHVVLTALTAGMVVLMLKRDIDAGYLSLVFVPLVIYLIYQDVLAIRRDLSCIRGALTISPGGISSPLLGFHTIPWSEMEGVQVDDRGSLSLKVRDPNKLKSKHGQIGRWLQRNQRCFVDRILRLGRLFEDADSLRLTIKKFAPPGLLQTENLVAAGSERDLEWHRFVAVVRIVGLCFAIAVLVGLVTVFLDLRIPLNGPLPVPGEKNPLDWLA